MGRLTELNETIKALNNAAPKVAPKPSLESEQQSVALGAVTKAIGELGTALAATTTEQLAALDESTTAGVIEIQAGMKALVRTIEGVDKSKDIRSKDKARELGAAVTDIVAAIGKIETKVVVESLKEQGTVTFDIHRDTNGFLKSVTATPT
jgi:hypothetical protein